MAEESLEVNISPETKGNPPTYPFEYFDAQVHFAQRWSEITDEPFVDALKTKTSLFRRVTDEKLSDTPNSLWQGMQSKIEGADNADEVSQIIFDTYLQQPHSKYAPVVLENQFGPYSYTYNPENNAVMWHAGNPDRTKGSPFHPNNLLERKQDLEMIFADIHQKHPDAQKVIGGSWLLSHPAYQAAYPPEIVDSLKIIRPPQMAFTGDSLWGQFINAEGKGNVKYRDRFIQNLAEAKSGEDLLNAFPYPVRYQDNDIKVFYEYYGIPASDKTAA